MAKIVDARGLLCPEPVLLTKKVIEKELGGTVEVMVDNSAAKENVSRFAENKGWKVNVIPQGNEYLLTLTK
ncbi:MAG: sulfurtransferase TusA family protein [Peptococcaceae bacterium]|nr:sulfurtransferase TusA family protein [Peptococcaceae bacterium]